CHSRAAQKARVNGKPRQFTSRSPRLVCNGMHLRDFPLDDTSLCFGARNMHFDSIRLRSAARLFRLKSFMVFLSVDYFTCPRRDSPAQADYINRHHTMWDFYDRQEFQLY
ncbi:hypothetical protein, partial [Burkholderia cepacia]|uniref:hypothetical protein n=1 Tax=Burkholderia cepacia TaxID=292 RepID=UPI001C6157BF